MRSNGRMMTSVAAVHPSPTAPVGRRCRAAMPVPTAASCTRSPAPASIAARRAPAGGHARTASRFFATPDAAERPASGPCRRCDPRARPIGARAEGRSRARLDRHASRPASLARAAGPRGGRLALAPATHLQAAAGRDAGRVRAGAPGGAPETRAQARPGDRRHLRGRLRVAEPGLRRGHGRPGDDAAGVPSWRPRRADSLHDRHRPGSA